MHTQLTKRKLTAMARYYSIQQLFKDLYTRQRLRIDDVYVTIFETYFIGQKRINEILQMEIPAEVVEYVNSSKANKSDNQLTIK